MDASAGSSAKRPSLLAVYGGTASSAGGSAAHAGPSRSMLRAFLPPSSSTPLPTVDVIPPLDDLVSLQTTLTALKERTTRAREGTTLLRDAARSRRDSLKALAARERAELDSLPASIDANDDVKAVNEADLEEGQIADEDEPTGRSRAPSSSRPPLSTGPKVEGPRIATLAGASPSAASELTTAGPSSSHSRVGSKDSTAAAGALGEASLPEAASSLPQPSVSTDDVNAQRHGANVSAGSGVTSPLTSGPSTAASPLARAGDHLDAESHLSASPVLTATAFAPSSAEKNKKRKRESSTTPGPATGLTASGGSLPKRARSRTVEADDANEPIAVAIEGKEAQSRSGSMSNAVTTAPTTSTPTPAPRLAVKLKLNPASRTHYQNAAAAAAAARATGSTSASAGGPANAAGSTASTSTAAAGLGPHGRRGSTPAGSGLALVPPQPRPGRMGPDGRMVAFPPHPEEPASLSWALPARTPSSILPKRPESHPPKPYARTPEEVQIDWTRWDWKAGVLGMNPQLGPGARAGTPALGADESMGGGGGTPGPSASDVAGRQANRKDRKGKEIQQTPILTFYAYTDAFFKTLTEDDLAWLSGESGDLEPFQMPALGRYYREVWAEEDAANMAAAAAAGYDVSSFDMNSSSWTGAARGRTGSTPSGPFGTPGPDDSFGGAARKGLGISGSGAGAGAGASGSARRRTRSATLGGLIGGGTGGVYSNTHAVHFSPAQLRDAHLFRDEEAKGGPLTERIVSALMPVAEEEGEADEAAVAAALGASRKDGAASGEAAADASSGQVSAPATGLGTSAGADPDSGSREGGGDGANAEADSTERPRVAKVVLKREPGIDGDGDDADIETEGEADADLNPDQVISRDGAMGMERRAAERPPAPPDKMALEQDLASYESRLAQELRVISVLSPTEASCAAAAAASKDALFGGADDGAMDLDVDGGEDGPSGDAVRGGGGGVSKSAGTSLPFFDPTLRTDDEISSALRRAQRALREQMAINAARKKRLFEIALDRMAYQDYASALSSVEKDVETHWLKRQKQLKARRDREKDREAAGAGGGGGAGSAGSSVARGRGRPPAAGSSTAPSSGGHGPLTHAEVAAAAVQGATTGGYSSSSSSSSVDSPSLPHATLPGTTAAASSTTMTTTSQGGGPYAGLPEPLAAALDLRHELKRTFDHLFFDVCPHSWKTPTSSVFADLRLGGGSGGGDTMSSSSAAAAAVEATAAAPSAVATGADEGDGSAALGGADAGSTTAT